MKEFLKKQLIKLPPSIYEVLYVVINIFIKPSYLYKNTNRLKLFRQVEPSLYQSSNKALKKYCLIQTNSEIFETYVESYKKQKVKCIKRDSQKMIKTKEPILICAVKNDIHRVKMQIEHHKKIGIKHFIYIDNMSSDGTYEYLLKAGVDVFQVDEYFNAVVKNSWFRQITDIYGYNQWYLILDSDELFVYPGMETKSLEKFIKFSEKNNMNYIQSFMIDMYSKEKINSAPTKINSMDKYDIKHENCYFDTETYTCEKYFRGKRITGGPRSRVFSTERNRFDPLLTKNPLIYLTRDIVYGIHHSIPYRNNFDKPIISGLLHYKFLPEDRIKYEKIAKEGNYSGGSAEYKQYLLKIEQEPELYFYYKDTQKFNTSMDLLKINIFNRDLSEKFISGN